VSALWVRLSLGGEEFAARRLAARSPTTLALLERQLPLTVPMLQDQWSGALLSSPASIPLDGTALDAPAPYQHPGLLTLDAGAGTLSLCYGQGRLQDGMALRPAIPVAEVVEPLDALVARCRAVQFEGQAQLTVEAVAGEPPAPRTADPEAPCIAIELDGARATARVLTGAFPGVTAQLLRALPLSGRATNTHSSGPLVRFWNPHGGEQGETPLELPAVEEARGQAVLYPGYLYYLPKPGFRGLRMALEQATAMRSPVGNGVLRLVPVAHLDGDREAIGAAAAGLRSRGALPMQITKGA
jgi:hypothetical protein